MKSGNGLRNRFVLFVQFVVLNLRALCASFVFFVLKNLSEDDQRLTFKKGLAAKAATIDATNQ
jgi:hypothetical protein